MAVQVSQAAGRAAGRLLGSLRLLRHARHATHGARRDPTRGSDEEILFKFRARLLLRDDVCQRNARGGRRRAERAPRTNQLGVARPSNRPGIASRLFFRSASSTSSSATTTFCFCSSLIVVSNVSRTGEDRHVVHRRPFDHAGPRDAAVTWSFRRSGSRPRSPRRSSSRPSKTFGSATRRRRWRLTFVFGLIHGFGFAGVLRELGLPTDGFVRTLLAFNLGVEAGQLAIVALLAVPAALHCEITERQTHPAVDFGGHRALRRRMVPRPHVRPGMDAVLRQNQGSSRMRMFLNSIGAPSDSRQR